MKKYVLLIFLLGILNVSAQKKIEVEMTKLAVESSMQPAFVVEIPQADSKDAIKMWEDQLVPRNLFDIFKKLPKMEKEGKEKWYIHGVVISEISPDTLSVFTRITSLKDRISFSALFKSENGFIGSANSNTALEERTSAYLRAFAVEVYRHAVQDELDDLNKELDRMEKEYSGLTKDNRKLDRKSSETETSLDTRTNSEETMNSVMSEDQMKDIEKEMKALRKFSKKKDKNTLKQEKLTRKIKEKEIEIEEVQKKLQNIE